MKPWFKEYVIIGFFLGEKPGKLTNITNIYSYRQSDSELTDTEKALDGSNILIENRQLALLNG